MKDILNTQRRHPSGMSEKGLAQGPAIQISAGAQRVTGHREHKHLIIIYQVSNEDLTII